MILPPISLTRIQVFDRLCKHPFTLIPDRIGRAVLPPEADHPPRLESRKLVARRRDEHQDRRLRLQQRVRSRVQARHVLWKSTLCCSGVVPG